MERPKDNNLRLLALEVHQIFDKFHDHYTIVEIKSDKCGVNSTIHFPGKSLKPLPHGLSFYMKELDGKVVLSL